MTGSLGVTTFDAGEETAAATRAGRREATMKDPRRRIPSGEDWTRRSWVEWVGKATVLGLGAEVLAACGIDHPGPEDGDGDARPDAGPRDGADAPPGDGAAEADAVADVSDAPLDAPGDGPVEGFPFAPGDGTAEIFWGWGERTVDRQSLSEILAGWRLRVDGMVTAPIDLSFAELVDLPRLDPISDFHCVEGWSILDVPWNGVHLETLFERAGVRPEATHATFHTLGGTYNESLPLPVALEPRTLLAYGIDGSTLPLRHGFPLRLVVPRLWAYKSAKYVHRIELTDRPVDGFWVAAGYPYDAEVPPGLLREDRY